MTITADQAATGQAVAGVTTVTLTWAVNPAAGSKALVALVIDNTVTTTVPSSVVDNGVTPATFTADLSIAPGAHYGKYIYRADGITLPASGQYKVTITFNATEAFCTAGGRTYLGVATGAPTGTNNATGTSSSVVTGNVTPAVTGALLFGMMDTDSAQNPETITLTTSGASSIYSNANGASFIPGQLADKLATTTSAQGLAWTTGDAPDWGGWVAVYSPAAGGALPAAASVTATAHPLIPPQALPVAALVTATAHALAPPVPLPHASVLMSAAPLAPLPQGYPDAALGAMVELSINGTWTDVTAVALPDGSGGYGQVKGGQPDGAQQPNPGSLNAVWDNPDASLSPRNTGGPYYPYLRQNTPARVSFTSPYGTYLRLEGSAGSYAWCPEASRLDIAGSLDMQAEVRLSDSRITALAFKSDGAGSFCWELVLQTDGTLALFWFDSGGTLRLGQSTVAFAVSTRAIRVTLDASTGTVTFYTAGSISGPWTQAGSAVSGTGGAATTVRTGSGTAPLAVGGHDAVTAIYGQVTAFRLYSGISGSGGTLVADAAFGLQAPGAAAWNDTLGNRWQLAGTAELSGRDYRLYGELSTANPVAAVSGGMARLTSAISGRLRRLQQAAAAPVDSPLYRAITTQAGNLVPVVYYPMEDGSASQGFGPAIGSGLMSVTSGTVKPAADTTFAASAALPLLNGAVLTATVPAYTGASGWAVRFPVKLGGTVPAGAELARVNVSGGACTVVKVLPAAPAGLQVVGLNGGGGTVFDSGVLGWAGINTGVWLSIEAVPSGGSTIFTLTSVAPGASSGSVTSHTVSGTYGAVTSAVLNTGGLLTDTVAGHLSVQKAVTTIFEFGQPLNAWIGEKAADRFARVCAEQGIDCRILGAPFVTQAMGAQPRGSAWTVLKDCAQTEQGIIYEPPDAFGVGLRTAEALGSQSAALTLDFTAVNLPGDLQPADDDQGFVNDVTASMPDGTAYRVTLDDGSVTSVSEPPAGRGRYASQPPFTFNLASSSQLAAAAALYLKIHSVNEPRYRNVVADFGIPGVSVADIARLRRGDLITIVNVPAVYQSGDISQLAWGGTETFGPGRKISWDCVPWSPYT